MLDRKRWYALNVLAFFFVIATFHIYPWLVVWLPSIFSPPRVPSDVTAGAMVIACFILSLIDVGTLLPFIFPGRRLATVSQMFVSLFSAMFVQSAFQMVLLTVAMNQPEYLPIPVGVLVFDAFAMRGLLRWLVNRQKKELEEERQIDKTP